MGAVKSPTRSIARKKELIEAYRKLGDKDLEVLEEWESISS
jgi:hypothetical protein